MTHANAIPRTYMTFSLNVQYNPFPPFSHCTPRYPVCWTNPNGSAGYFKLGMRRAQFPFVVLGTMEATEPTISLVDDAAFFG